MHAIPGDAFRFVTGKLGSGKTLICVGVAMEYLNRGAQVATNINLYPERFPNKANKNIRITRLPDHPNADDLQALGVGNPTLVIGPDGEYEPGPNYSPKKNSLLLLDELAQSMNSRDWNNADRKKLISYLVMLRKMGWDSYFLVQHIDMIDVQIRQGLARETGYCKNLNMFNVPFISPVFKMIFGFPLKLPKMHKVTFRDGYNPTNIKTDSFMIGGKNIYKYYNTAQKFSSEYDSGSYCLLTPWHLVGRYQQRQSSFKIFKYLAYPAWAIYLLTYYIITGSAKYETAFNNHAKKSISGLKD